LYPSVRIILVVAIFNDSLKSTIISSNVGNVVKSGGRGINSAIRIISTDADIDIVKKKSSIADGRGTIIIDNIAIKNSTTVKSLEPVANFKTG
jgi:hypothetical protein